MIRLVLCALAALFWAMPLSARCVGTDLIAELDAGTRAALQHAADSVPFARGNIFRATKDGQVIEMVGTYHFPDPRHADTLAQVLPLLDGAAVLLVEAGPEEERRLTAELQRRPDFMFLTDGPTLPELLGEDDWQQVAQAMRARGIPGFLAAKMRPWYVAMMLGIPGCALDAVKSGEKGLDHRLIAAAAAKGLPVRALEPFDTLFTIFGDLSAEDEMEMIRAALLMAARPEDMAVTLANAYFSGQSRLLWEFLSVQAMALPGQDPAQVQAQLALMDEAMNSRRNRAWIPVLTEAAAKGRVLAAFGALHLPGEQGVVALLASQGWQIERLDN